MIYRHTQEQINDYFQRIGINQSSLKIILSQGVQAFYDQMQEAMQTDDSIQEEKEHFLIGDSVDMLINQGKEAFEAKYHASNAPKPPEKPMNIIRALYDKLIVKEEPYIIAQNMRANNTPLWEIAIEKSNDGDKLIPAEMRPLRFFKKELYDLCNTVTDSKGNIGFYLNNKIPSDKLIKGKPDDRSWMEDKRVDRLLGDGLCEGYWNDLLKAKGKQVLSDEQSSCIDAVYISLTTHPFTSYLFDDKEYIDNRSLDIIYQLPLYWDETINAMTSNGMQLVQEECKCMLDNTIINHEKRTISPLDDKTTYEYITKFHKQIRARRYDIQGSWYTRGIQKCLNTISNIVGKDVSSYHIENFAFVVESTKHTGTPLIFPLNDELLLVGMKGDNDKLEGWVQALRKFASFKAFDYSINNLLAERNGIVWVDKDFQTNLIEIE